MTTRNLPWHSWIVIVILCLLVSLGSCGFHLRGVTELPPKLSRTHISGISPYSDFAVNLRQQLRANGVEIVEANQSTATLRITRNRIDRQVLAVGSDGKVREYELFAAVSFEVRGADAAVLLENQTITLSREFIFDPDNVLGKREEEALLRENLRKDIVRLMIYRLQTI